MSEHPAKLVLWQYDVVARFDVRQNEMSALPRMLADRLDVEVDDLWSLMYEAGHGGRD